MRNGAERKAFKVHHCRGHCPAAAEAGMANEVDDTVVAKQSAGITSQTRGRTCCAPAGSAAARGSAAAGPRRSVRSARRWPHRLIAKKDPVQKYIYYFRSTLANISQQVPRFFGCILVIRHIYLEAAPTAAVSAPSTEKRPRSKLNRLQLMYARA